MTAGLSSLPPERQSVVRAQVRDLLSRSQSFQALPPDERRRLARSMVDVVAALADPSVSAGLPVSEGQAKFERMDKKLVQDDFKAAAVRDGTKAFKDLVDTVDFPKFVAGLIDGVFNSIVSSSIRQMEAYGKLLEGVVKSVEQFATDHITANQARDYLSDRHPSLLQTTIEDGKPKLTSGADDEKLADLAKQLGLKSIDLSDEASEAELVRRAQLEMARMRQQQLATMVMLGINRIVVTDGLINAKVVFDVQASDKAKRTNRASSYDEDSASNTTSGGGWFSDDFTDTSSHKTVVQTSSKDDSESKVEAKAKLTGEVRVAFKTDAVPLANLANQVQIATVQERAQK